MSTTNNELSIPKNSLGSRDNQQIDWVSPLATTANYLMQYNNIRKNRALLKPTVVYYTPQTSGYIPVVKDLSREQLAAMENAKNSIRSGYNGADPAMEAIMKASANNQRNKLAMEQAALRAQNIARQEEAVNQYRAEDVQRNAAINAANIQKAEEAKNIDAAAKIRNEAIYLKDKGELISNAVKDIIIDPVQKRIAYNYQRKLTDTKAKAEPVLAELNMNIDKLAYASELEKPLIQKEIDRLNSEYNTILDKRPKNPNWDILRLFSTRKSNL